MRDGYHFVNRVFENERWEVDGHSFEHCIFKRCRIIFSATNTVSFKECTFADCDWVFDGSAEITLSYLSALYRGLGEGGQQLVENMFQRVRQGNIGGDDIEDAHELKAVVSR